MKSPIAVFALSFFLSGLLSAAEPTESREWNSTKGQTMTASATAFEEGVVTMVRADGNTVEVPITLLVEEDQEFIKAHFAEAPVEEIAAPTAPATKPKRKGRRGTVVLGPEKSRANSHYFYYVPETVPDGVKAPALFWTGGGRSANASDLQKLWRQPTSPERF